jgi:hypothetical protein
MIGRPRVPVRAGLGVTMVAIIVAGCSATPAPPLTLDDVVAERNAAREAVERQRFDAFVEQSSERLNELGVPLPEFQGVVALRDWVSAVATCIDRLDPRADTTPVEQGGFSVDYFGVVGDVFERSSLVIESCDAQYGVAEAGAPLVRGAREAAWRYQDATQRVLPCLRYIGAPAPSPPSSVAFIEHLGTGREWSPYALVAADQATLARAVALCPPSASVLQAHLVRLDDAPTTTGLTPPRGSSLVP